jgi:ankyrin repeat protein
MFVTDVNGKAAIHVAAAKLDLDTFEMLILKGADPMMADKVGNTILHIMAYGAIRDIEYDFIKEIIERY